MQFKIFKHSPKIFQRHALQSDKNLLSPSLFANFCFLNIIPPENVQASHELSIFGFTQKAGCQAKIIGKSLILFNQPQNQNYPAPPPPNIPGPIGVLTPIRNQVVVPDPRKPLDKFGNIVLVFTSHFNVGIFFFSAPVGCRSPLPAFCARRALSWKFGPFEAIHWLWLFLRLNGVLSRLICMCDASSFCKNLNTDT